jgi:putative membrane protein
MSQAEAARPIPDTTQLADERTALAHERTLMAWVRTATSLISFGFTIYKFFQLRDRPHAEEYVLGPREFALLMIGTGLTSLVLATFQHYHYRRKLRQHDIELSYSVAMFAAVLVSCLGIMAIVLTVARA